MQPELQEEEYGPQSGAKKVNVKHRLRLTTERAGGVRVSEVTQELHLSDGSMQHSPSMVPSSPWD